MAKKTGDAAVLERAKTRLLYVAEQDRDNRASQRADTEFVYVPGKQWKQADRDRRTKWGDPCMEFPQLKQFVSQVVNDQRQNRPGIRVHAASGEASEEVAEILQGLCRSIEYDSRAEGVYDCGYQHSVVGGRGYWRIVTEYESEDSFNQKLVIKRIPDPLSVYLDPDFQEPDGGDREYGFVVESVPLDEFEERYPGADPVSVDSEIDVWRPDEEHVTVADYYEREKMVRTLVFMSDGNQGWKDELPKKLPAGVSIAEERDVDVYSVKWYTIAGGDQILKTRDWSGTIIPIVCTMGDEIIVDGKRIYQGLITQAKDSQALFNYGMTQQAIHLALTPRAPYIAAFGQTEDFGDMWAKANERNYGVLVYKPVTVDGNLASAPSRQPPSSPDAGWINWTQQMTGLMRSTIGMYQNSLGMQGQETSGRAIMARERQGDNATFHFQDNLSRAIALTGRIVVECIPTIYDTERIINTVGVDDVRKSVTVNQEMPDPDNPLMAIRENDITVGKYAVTVQSGPSYATKRQETADLLNGMVQAYPPLMQIAGDLVVKAQDIPDADAIAERLKMTLPPPILQSIEAKEQEEKGAKAPDPAMVAQMQQMQQQMEMMQQGMQQMQAENEQLKAGAQVKMATAQTDAQVTLQKAELDAQTELQKAEIASRSAIQRAEIDQQTKLIIAQAQALAAPPAVESGAEPEESSESVNQQVMLGTLYTINQTLQTLAAPKRVIYEDGRPVGVESVQ